MAERSAPAPSREALTRKEEYHARRFIQKLQSHGPSDVVDVAKINPAGLVAKQLEVILDKANSYSATIRTSEDWNRIFLPLEIPELRSSSPFHLSLNGLPSSKSDIRLPHSECFLSPVPGKEGLHIVQGGRHASVTLYDGRMMLWAGYHRSLARMGWTAPDAMDRSVLYAVNSNTLPLPSSADAGSQLLRDPRGLRAPLLRDFFDEAFFMRVRRLKKRYELQIRADIVEIDDD